MSAIAGVYWTDGRPVSRHEVDRMAAVLTHRGPDGTAAWSGGPTALAHCALWTTPEARREPQPFASAASNVIVADARLDNRLELVAALGLTGERAAEIGDSELILRAYERWGEDCAPRLLGDFAFAIWDPRNQQVFCARDHVGVKSLYYHQAPTTFLFASEIKALLTSPHVPYQLNPARVADHLVGLIDDQAITFYRDIYRLPAAHTLTVTRKGRRIRRYWSLDSSRKVELGSDEAFAEAFRECFTEAVRCRLRGEHRVGCLLSGGLDSSSIAVTARDLLRTEGRESLETFTAIFPGLSAADLRRIDEREFVEAVVRQGGVQNHPVRGDLLSPLTDVGRALGQLDEAFAAPNLYLHWALYGAAQARGVRVLLDGIDGDTTVSHGLEYLPALARSGRGITLGRELLALSRRHGVGVRHLLWQYVLDPVIPGSLRRGLRYLGREPDRLADSVIRPDFARRMGVVDRLEALESLQRRSGGSARQAHAAAMESGLIPYALELADKAAAGFGVEPRYPFFDRRLMELCLAMPGNQKLRDGWSRFVMRRAMAGRLPETVRWRSSKANLAPNFKRRLLDNDRNLLAEIVLDQPGMIDEYVDVPTLRRTYDRYLADPGSEADALTIFNAVVLGLWLQRAKIA